MVKGIVQHIFETAERGHKKGCDEIQAVLPGTPQQDCSHDSVASQCHKPAGVIEVCISNHVVGFKDSLPDQDVCDGVEKKGNDSSDDGAVFFHRFGLRLSVPGAFLYGG